MSPIRRAEKLLRERRGQLLAAQRTLEAYRKNRWPSDMLRQKEQAVLWMLNCVWGAQEYFLYCNDQNHKSDNRWLGRDK